MSGNSVFAQVVASFSATPTAGCAPLHVTFTDLSTGNPTSWSWNLGNGPVPIIPNPGDIYSSGLWTVTLTVSDGVSTSTIVKTNYINVYNPHTAGFTMSNDTA